MGKKSRQKKLRKKLKKLLKRKIAAQETLSVSSPKTPTSEIPAATPVPQVPTISTAKPVIPDQKSFPPKPESKIQLNLSGGNPYIKSDLKKIGLMILSIVIILTALYIISLKTTWLNFLSDKIFHLFRLS